MRCVFCCYPGDRIDGHELGSRLLRLADFSSDFLPAACRSLRSDAVAIDIGERLAQGHQVSFCAIAKSRLPIDPEVRRNLLLRFGKNNRKPNCVCSHDVIPCGAPPNFRGPKGER